MSRFLLLSAAAAVAAAQVTALEEQLINGFMVDYSRNYEIYKAHCERSAKDLQALMDKTHFIVPPELSFRTKAPDSLKQKLFERAADKDYKVMQDLHDDITDMVGLRVTAFTPSVDLPLIEGLLNTTFKMTAWKRGDPRGQYPGNNYNAILEGAKVEIQTRGAFDHAFLQFQHKVNYKPKPGYALNDQQKAKLQQLRNAVATAKDTLAELVASILANKPHGHHFLAEETSASDSWVSTGAAFDSLWDAVSEEARKPTHRGGMSATGMASSKAAAAIAAGSSAAESKQLRYNRVA